MRAIVFHVASREQFERTLAVAVKALLHHGDQLVVGQGIERVVFEVVEELGQRAEGVGIVLPVDVGGIANASASFSSTPGPTSMRRLFLSASVRTLSSATASSWVSDRP